MAEGGIPVHINARHSSLEEQLSKFPAHLLDVHCAESHLGKLVKCITTDTMVMMTTDLGLTDVEVDDIQTAWPPRKPAVQRLDMFKKWLKKFPSASTYRYNDITRYREGFQYC